MPFETPANPELKREYVFDLSKTEAVCGELPKTFEEGVKATAKWWEKRV